MKEYNWQSYVDFVIRIFWSNIFNVCIIFLWLNVTYIIPNFYHTTLYFECEIGKTMRFHKWSFNGVSYLYAAHLFSMTFIFSF